MDSVQTAALRRAADALRLAAQPAPKGGAKFSLARALLVLAERGDLDGLEREVLAEAGGAEFDPRRPVIPLRLLSRDLSADGSPSAGGFLVDGDTFEPADLLRSYSVTARAGVEIRDGLRGDAVLPVTTARPAITWLSDETAALSNVQPTIGAVSFTPKHAAALTKASGQLLRQSASADAYVRRQLLEAAGLAVDEAVLSGSGSGGEPQGILGTPGIGSQSGTSLDLAGVVHMKKLVADSGAQDEAVSFIGSTDARELLEKRERAAGSGFIWDGGRVASLPAYATTTLPAATLVAADFSRVLVGIWGVELLVDRYTLFRTGAVQYRVSAWLDVGVSQPSAFCKSEAIT